MKYKTMAQSPFRFFKGTAPLFYEDLRKEDRFPHSPVCWLCTAVNSFVLSVIFTLPNNAGP